jgi:hypothetical protein
MNLKLFFIFLTNAFIPRFGWKYPSGYLLMCGGMLSKDPTKPEVVLNDDCELKFPF